MTAYASRGGTAKGLSWQWEMRSVNARGLDIRLRLPDGIDGLETTIRTMFKAVLNRGNVTVSLRLAREDSASSLRLDEAQLDRVLDALDVVQDRAMSKGVTLGQPTAADVLAHRGVLLSDQGDTDDTGLATTLTSDLAPLLSDFTAMRGKEGAAMQRVLADQLDRISELVKDAATIAADRLPAMRKTLRAQFARVLAETTEADEQRIAQELALLAVKQDITEEIDRLAAHVSAAWDLIESDGPVGRKLDFLVQELNREANTLCAKSQHAPLTQVGLDLKAVIDQMREQVQNVE
ncbi:MAG: YicC family protein [Loktanella sp.]|nr:YicC family protein [Loktanella sp.]